jgi:hypothetical protein
VLVAPSQADVGDLAGDLDLYAVGIQAQAAVYERPDFFTRPSFWRSPSTR